MLDPFVSRPDFRTLLLHRLESDVDAIARHLPAKVDGIVCGHSHYDHILDAPTLARRTGARVVGSQSTCMWARAAGIPPHQLVEVPPAGGSVRIGDIDVELVPSQHGRIALGRVPLPGQVRAMPSHAGRFFHYRMGGAFGVLLHSQGMRIYHNGSADLIDAELQGKQADVLLACLAGRKGTERYLPRLVASLSPKLIIPTHHDAFFGPLREGPRLLPGIDLDGFISDAHRAAGHAGVISPGYEEDVVVPPDVRAAVIAD